MSLNKKLFSFSKQSGFTLLELMIALSLGLIVSAIAIQLALTGQRGVSTQQALSDLQNDSLFGLEAFVREIRLANLNAVEPMINDTVLHGGIVLDARNYTQKFKIGEDGKPTTTLDITLKNALSEGAVSDSSNLVGQASDQLVIQYKNSMGNQFDCEGRQIVKDAYVVQRYFLRNDTNRGDPNKPLALACKAFSYMGDEPAEIDLSGDGQIMIPRVDHLSIQLVVARDGMNNECSAIATADGQLDCFGQISIEDYQSLTAAEKPQIVAVKVGLLVRSNNTVGNNDLFNADKQYQVLDTTAKLNPDDKNKLYMRNVVTQTIAIRNGFGIAK
ncbi:PilW family protein [Acinetobacter indicus]|uniref:PilW family protein n=1 Tax=Acinetobacter indicus TaxID=756892 RepID=UPI0025764027|nr:PilW family protein [Acinetobacter indicus]MDM1272208.1 PilW family protein [Acinetobacter indicus]